MDRTTSQSITFVLGGFVGGGAEKVASTLIKQWHSEGFKITVISRLGPEHDFFNIPDGIERIVLGGEGESQNKLVALLKNAPFVWKLRKSIKRAGNPTVISFLTKANIHTLLASIGLKVRVIISERNDTTRQQYPAPWPQLRRLLYRYSDIVTANSDVALQGMKPYVPTKKLRFVPNPVAKPNQKARPHNSHVLLNVGRLVPHKSQHLLIKAYSKLSNEVKQEWKCTFLGEGEEKENYIGLAVRMGVCENIEFKGMVENPSDYYKSAGIFVLTSKYEGTPNVLLESMAHGLPSIISDCLPGALELIRDGENGLVFKSGDADHLFHQIDKLVTNPELREQLGRKAAESVTHLSTEKVVKIWNKIIQG